MPGIDKFRVVGKDEEELDELTCSICQDIFDEPLVTQCCRQSFCTVCIHQWLENNKTCPNDRKRLIFDQLLPAPRIVINLLNNLKIKCENYGNGCQTILKFEEMANHMKTCNTCDSCKTSQKLLSDNKKIIETFESEVERMKKELVQSKDELSIKQITIETLKSVNEKLKTGLDQSNTEVNKFNISSSISKQTEEEAIINANNISTPIKENVSNTFSEEEVTYLTNLAKSALSLESFKMISKFILDQIELKPDFKQMGWVIITNFKEHLTHYSVCDKLLVLTFNDITISIIGFNAIKPLIS